MLSMVRRILHTATFAAVVVALPLLVTSCKKKTPDERLEEARSLVSEQRQVPLGVLKLKELIKEFPDDPTTVEARFMLAEIYMSLGRKENMENAFKELEAVYTKLGLKDQRGVQAHQFASQVIFSMEEPARALEHAKAGEAGVDDGPAKIEMGFLLSQMRLVAGTDEEKLQAENFFKDTALNSEEASYRGQAREMIADYYRRTARFDESNAVYDAYLAKYPDDEVNSQLILAQALNFRLAQNEQKFEETFKTGSDKLLAQIDAELNPETKTRMQRDTARLFEVAGKTEMAKDMLQRIMAENVGKMAAMEAQLAIGEMHLRTGQLDEAKILFEAIRRDNPGTPMAQGAEQALKAIDERVAELAKAASDTSPTLQQTPVAPATTE
jgi:tetratricopeptide (TPR) repeat protein